MQQTPTPGLKRAVTASVVGTIIEWFDYALYGAAAGLIINKIFFPDLSAFAGVLAAFATFAVGFFVRPLGGLVISHIGDRYGRKPALIFSITLMGVGTVAIGLLPGYHQIGIAAPALLVIMRMAQGFGAGAEYAGALTLLYEYAPKRLRGFYTALLQSATVIGIIFASLAFWGVSLLPAEMMTSWGWRVPFLSSAVLFVIAIYIRRHLDETPEYVQAMQMAEQDKKEHKLPLKVVLTRYPRELFWGFLMMSGHNANVYILSAFSISYMTNTLHLPKTTALSALFISAWCAVVSAPVMGWLADKYNPAKIYMAAALFTVIYAFPLFMFIDSGDLLTITLGMSVAFIISYGAMAGPQGILLARVFPTQYRYSGISVAREMNGMLVAGPTPLISAFLVEIAGGKPTYVAVYLATCCLLTTFAVHKLVSMQPAKREVPVTPERNVVEG
ncbi:MHS family MFS transporter [Escherichia coli]|nr:MFS transporter [Escherichia coli]EFJ1988237.1 MHS family MFS transporter [Escherichia coli]EFO6491989.1 MHS family MFS transporter [Escherichia coli]EFT1905771.1 MHS family MFS transporter [Escherichia coli]EGP4635146.1 MHS family MFS transporter [Escherichia coli]